MLLKDKTRLLLSESSEYFESKADSSNSTEDIVVTRLRHRYASTASKSSRDAMATDPMELYIFDTPDKMNGGPERRRINWFKLMGKLNMHYSISSEHKVALTVHDGIALVIATYAANSKHGKTRKDLFSHIFETLYRKVSFYFLSAEQKKRFKELLESFDKLFSTLGEDIKDMIYLDMLMTAPAFQGHGYGSALVEAISDIADSQSRRVYLVSSNIANTGFYNSHGFETTATAALGEGNPTWAKKPVIISLMVRGAGEKLT